MLIAFCRQRAIFSIRSSQMLLNTARAHYKKKERKRNQDLTNSKANNMQVNDHM